MNYWIQRADFESKSFEANSADEMIRAFAAHDWPAELKYRSDLESRDEEWCDPGFGIVIGKERILHLCPLDDGSLHCHYHYDEITRFLGLTPTRKAKIETWRDQSSASEGLIRMVVEGRHEEMLSRSRRVL